MTPVAERPGLTPERFRQDVVPAGEPVVVRGLAADWPAVRAADPAAYLAGLAGPGETDLLVGPPEIGGRFFYADDLAGLNFARERAGVAATLARLRALADDPRPPALALQSVPAAALLPGFAAAHPAPFGLAVPPRLWIGNRVVTALHHDAMSNVAVVVAGRRRFTLIPPTVTPDLYVGPFEFTPAGTPVSLVDPDAPDLARFPRAAAALAQAQVAELGPGDAIHIPYLWWHQVRSLDPVSVLANYWWQEAPPAAPGLAPIDALIHARLVFGAMPANERAAWAAMFAAIVFADAPAHVPEARQGVRGRLTAEVRDRLRRQLGRLMAG